MPTKPKPVIVLEHEKRSHRTKAELAQRKDFEQSLAGGTPMRELPQVKANPRAHREYFRLQKLLKNIQKNDALYQNTINRYCLLLAECYGYEDKQERFYQNVLDLEAATPADGRTMEYFRTLATLQGQVNACDKLIMAKRKMLLDIEKESVMTIAAALRTIPKKPVDDGDTDGMDDFLARRPGFWQA